MGAGLIKHLLFSPYIYMYMYGIVLLYDPNPAIEEGFKFVRQQSRMVLLF